MTSSKPDRLPKPPPPNAITRGFQHMNLGETHSVHNKPEIKVRGEKCAAIFKDEVRHKTCGDSFFQKVNQRLKPDFLEIVENLENLDSRKLGLLENTYVGQDMMFPEYLTSDCIC